MRGAISQDGGWRPTKPTPIIRDAEQLLRRGIDALEHDRFEEAAGLLKQAVDLAPESPMASLALGIALVRLLRIPRRQPRWKMPSRSIRRVSTRVSGWLSCTCASDSWPKLTRRSSRARWI